MNPKRRRMDAKPFNWKLTVAEEDSEEDDDEEEDDEVEDLWRLIRHREAEIAHFKEKIDHYNSKLAAAEEELNTVQGKLDFINSRSNGDQRLPNPVCSPPSSTALASSKSKRKFELETPISTGVVSSPPGSKKSVAKSSNFSVSSRASEKKSRDRIPKVGSKQSPRILEVKTFSTIPSQHKRKLRSLEFCPTNDESFVTTALDGFVNLWQIQMEGCIASLLDAREFISPLRKKWPGDIAWHPDGTRLFAAYGVDNSDSQISFLDLNAGDKKKIRYLEASPHSKEINCINFMPWPDPCFATGGLDHAVVLWREQENSWKHEMVHEINHSSAVMDITGLRQKDIMLSVGADRRIIGFNVATGRIEFVERIDHKCLSVLPNPRDFNLYMVQTAAPGNQLRLFDIRSPRAELHSFGWKQVRTEGQSSLINQSWSPNGWYISSGSADPMIHIFDIRYNGKTPLQSLQAHQKRVFKAVWHQSASLMISLSSDLHLALHEVH